ncbi:hypothetical protein NQ314_020135 [Rhamnusium bicolor]|uniref:Transposase n=1 Tax=Rhamnusium bicolor TaxID=1586634 RepID=A0AAV8WM76_9CUCU|nr:hypothetical protein NQ314_020135 [Rhamnusium bicolor]
MSISNISINLSSKNLAKYTNPSNKGAKFHNITKMVMAAVYACVQSDVIKATKATCLKEKNLLN